MTDESGSIFWYNQRWYDYTGTTLETMRGWGWQNVHHPRHVERVVAHIKHCFETGKTWEDTFPLRGKDGTYRWFLSHALPIRDESGRIIRWFGTNTDITQRLKTEQELRSANNDLEQFAYSVSHDLQEPLRSVSIYSELLIRRCADRQDGEAQELLRHLAEGASRMEVLVGDLLEYTRVIKLDVSTDKTDANSALATVLSNLAETIAGADARVISGELPEVRVSGVHLQQIFQNLISNALRYRGREPPVVQVEARQHGGGYALFSVKDNGIGFEPQYKEQIFGLFKRLHASAEYPGTGLGLAICRRIVERYRGRIWAESSPGEGSTFYFTLPRRLPRMLSDHARGGQQGGRVSHAGGARSG
jgi:PAS domain S-box-containing protein